MISLFLAGTVFTQVASDVTTTQPPASPAVAEGQASSTTAEPAQQVETIVVKARPQTRDSRIDRVV